METLSTGTASASTQTSTLPTTQLGNSPTPTPQTDFEHLRPWKHSDIFWRGLYGAKHEGTTYVAEVDYFDIRERVALYRDGRLVERRSSPARFALSDGSAIEAAMALYGMERAHLIDGSGRATALKPLPGTAEAHRMGFERNRPVASRALAATAWVVLAVALITQIPATLNSLGHWLGFSVPTFALPGPANIVLSVGGILAGLDRAFRMKHNPLLDD